MGRTVAEAIAGAAEALAAAGSGTARLDAEVLFVHAAGGAGAGWDAARLIRDARAPAAAAVLARFQELVRRRAAREPVAYVVGEREFWSRRFRVDARVLVPRPETELVVEEAMRLLRDRLSFRRDGGGGGVDGGAGGAPPQARVGDLPPRIVDVGTGSGAIALSLAGELAAARRAPSGEESFAAPSRLEILALDCSGEALAVARVNAAELLADRSTPPLRWLRGDLTTGLASGSVALIVANPPYLSRAEHAAAPPELRHEPFVALVAGDDDGLGVLRRLIADAFRVLCPGGFLVSEIGSDQAADVASLATERGFEEVAVRRDLAGRDRVLTARRPAVPRFIGREHSDEERGEDGWTRSSFEGDARSRGRFGSAARRTPPCRSSSPRS